MVKRESRKFGMDHFEPEGNQRRVTPSGGPLPIGTAPEDRIAAVESQKELDDLREQFGDMMMTQSVTKAIIEKRRELEKGTQAA